MLITLILMGLALFLIVVPVVPVSALEWAIAMVFVGLDVALTGSSRVPLFAIALMTIFMLAGATSGLWMPFFGLKGGNLSCMGLIAFFVGMMAGTALIPIPFLGTILGGMIAVFIMEYLRRREASEAVAKSKVALKLVVYGMIAEFVFAAAVVLTFVVAVMTTSP
ncbi:MAG: DUF456 family protein [Aggregatilineales bacterium]